MITDTLLSETKPSRQWNILPFLVVLVVGCIGFVEMRRQGSKVGTEDALGVWIPGHGEVDADSPLAHELKESKKSKPDGKDWIPGRGWSSSDGWAMEDHKESLKEKPAGKEWLPGRGWSWSDGFAVEHHKEQ